MRIMLLILMIYIIILMFLNKVSIGNATIILLLSIIVNNLYIKQGK